MPRSWTHRRGWLVSGIALILLGLLGGCSSVPLVTEVACPGEKTIVGPWSNPRLALPERLDRGYTIVLPGIWGSQPVDYGIVMGLQDGNVQSAIELHDWTAGLLRLVYNLRALEHNQGEARKIAAKIIAYQDRYPGRPVHLVGYSGGAGVAVLTLEALPADRKVTDAILLAPTLASDYDLRPAISHTTHGIRNFYSPFDVPILMVLSTAFGTTEGRHTPAAGAIGFQAPANSGPDERKQYEAHVPQKSYNLAMLMDGHGGGHFGWANRTFVSRHVAPLLTPSVDPLPPTNADPANVHHVARATTW
jgi:pimeloyl-ACP methyl ester carboxylesterase